MTSNQHASDFHKADERGYVLGRDHAAAARLNFQFYLWKESLQFNIHPSIPIPKQAWIADVATGTAIWLTDLAREVNDAHLDGFDLELEQAPPSQWLPASIKLRTWNIFNEVPAAFLEKYDIVHVRLLVLVVQNSDPRPILRNLIKMLKPGGYLQWDDLDSVHACVRTVDESLQIPALRQLHKMMYSDGKHDWTLQLADIAQQEGLGNTELYKFEDRAELAKANGEQHLLTMEEVAAHLLQMGNAQEASKLHQLIQNVYKESLMGAAISIPRVVCVGRKPMRS